MKNYFESPFKGKPLVEQVKNPNIKVGRYSYYSGYYHGHSFDDCARYLLPDRDDVDKLIIGSFCSIGTGASFIMAGNQGHRYDWVTSFPFFYMNEEPAFSESVDAFQAAGDTVIGSDVWIGSEAMIMPGVKVGHGAVIGSRALVTKDIEPYTIVGGNPAKEIKKRFSEQEISMLLDMKWWDWPLEQIKEAMPLLFRIRRIPSYAQRLPGGPETGQAQPLSGRPPGRNPARVVRRGKALSGSVQGDKALAVGVHGGGERLPFLAASQGGP